MATWEHPNIDSSSGLKNNNGSNTVDGDTSSYAVLNSDYDGEIEWEAHKDYSSYRIHWANAYGECDHWHNGNRIENNVNHYNWVTYDRSGSAGDTFRVQVDDSTNKRIAEIQIDTSFLSAPSSPRNISATVDANDQITLDWDAPSDWGGETGNYRIQIQRDGTDWVYASGGPNTVGSSMTSATYNSSNSDAYDTQVGIDSSFRFRVRAENSAGNSGWDYSSTVYTDPIPPHNPSVSRPDADTFTINWTHQSDIADNVVLYVREDTGSGYGGWNWISTETSSNESVTYTVGTSYQFTLKEDARYQFRLQSQEQSSNSHSEFVYSDYGNSGNVFFEDGFESGDTSAWDNSNGMSMQSGSHSSTNVSGADEGSQYIYFSTNGLLEKNIDLSSVDPNAPIILSFSFSAYSGGSGEYFNIEAVGNGTTETLAQIDGMYNKQGWTKKHIIIPSSVHESSTTIRFERVNAIGIVFDNVTVSDILHEYTTPTAPTDLALDATTDREITAIWTNNASISSASNSVASILLDGTEIDKNWSKPVTFTGLDDGEEYTVRVREYYPQHRRGSSGNFVFSSWTSSSSITALPVPANIDAEPTS